MIPLLSICTPFIHSFLPFVLFSLSFALCVAHRASASTLALNSALYAARMQSMHIQEIPPFRKKSTDSAEHTGSSASSSPQRTTMRQLSAQRDPQQTIPEIPPFKTRKISAESAMHLNMSVRSQGERLYTRIPPYKAGIFPFHKSFPSQVTYCVSVAILCTLCVDSCINYLKPRYWLSY